MPGAVENLRQGEDWVSAHKKFKASAEEIRNKKIVEDQHKQGGGSDGRAASAPRS